MTIEILDTLIPRARTLVVMSSLGLVCVDIHHPKTAHNGKQGTHVVALLALASKVLDDASLSTEAFGQASARCQLLLQPIEVLHTCSLLSRA
jgi:hypothetical protein